MAITDRRSGVTPSAAIKAPCRVATTINITLSGLITVDGVDLVHGDRVLVKNQTSQIDNGIWVASPGNWSRAADANKTGDLMKGTIVTCSEGAINALRLFQQTETTPSIGVDVIVFSPTAANQAGAILEDDFPNTGLMTRTGDGAFNTRTITAGTGVSVANGAGISGNPVISLSSETQASLALADTALQADDVPEPVPPQTFAMGVGDDTVTISGGYGEAGIYQVFLNGALLEETEDWTATDGDTVVLTSPITEAEAYAADDTAELIVFIGQVYGTGVTTYSGGTF